MPTHMPRSYQQEIERYKRALDFAKTVQHIHAFHHRAIVTLAPYFQHRGHILMPIPAGFGLQQVWPRTGVVLSVGEGFSREFPVKPGDELLFDKRFPIVFYGESNHFADHSEGLNNRDETVYVRACDILAKIEHDLVGKKIRWQVPHAPAIPDGAHWPPDQCALVVEESGAFGGLVRCEDAWGKEVLVPYTWMMRDGRGIVQTF
jgi:hypothetical protein